MSEFQPPVCNKAAGDSVDINNDSSENQLIKPACQLPQQADGDNQQPLKDDNANTKEITEANNNDSPTVSQLQEDLLKRTHERDEFRSKLEEAELKLSGLVTKQQQQQQSESPADEDAKLRRELDELKAKLTQTRLALDDRERRVANQDSQISALSKQVSSLKEVVAITKDMLSIRNMEVRHLQDDVDKMEGKISAERDRHNAMIDQMDVARRLNDDLKKEYHTQLQLFQDLRAKYEHKVSILSEENRALETAVLAQPAS